MESLTANKLNSIDDVIQVLEEIIIESERRSDPLGYFAVLYQKVTKKVREGKENDYFDDGYRMEQLDIVFARRYIEAYIAYHNHEPVSAAWKKAFELSSDHNSIVLKNLLLGINTHINLDLGVAAAEISGKEGIHSLKGDFFKINKILSSLIEEVERGLSGIWPLLKFMVEKGGRMNGFLVDMVIRIARADAWRFAKHLAGKSPEERLRVIARRDRRTALIAKILGLSFSLVAGLISFTSMQEHGSVAEKIVELKYQTQNIPAYGIC